MAILSILGGAALLGSVASARICTNVTVPVNINARQGMYNVPKLESNFDAVAFSLNVTDQGRNFTDDSLIGFQNVQGAYTLSAKHCRPGNDSSANPTVQILSHGIGFDKSYWDLPYNGYNYSYTDVALANGFHTVAIDRFGIGNSSHADPLNVVQANAEVSALYEVTMALRNGTFPSVSTKYQKVLHVGHSFGSAQSYALSALHPNVTDGIALTGFSMNGTWVAQTFAGWGLHLARLNQPLRFGNLTVQRTRFSNSWFSSSTVSVIQSALQFIGLDVKPYDVFEEVATTEVGDIINGWNATVAPVAQDLPTGYLTWTDLTSNIYAFFYPGSFDTGAAIFSEMTKQPVTLGEIFTLPIAPSMSTFSGPVLVLTGEKDNIYCGGDCLATGGAGASIPDVSVRPLFPDASAFEAYIQPSTGHGLNFHYNSTAGYQVIQDWFLNQSLGSS